MNSRPYVITDMTPDDVEPVAVMHAQSWLDTYPNEQYGITRQWIEQRNQTKKFTPERTAERKIWIAQNANNPDVMPKVARDMDGTVIGMISPFRKDGIQRVGAIYIAKEYYGTGLAQALMDEIIAWADPAQPLLLNVAIYNKRAQNFYRKYGFKEVAGSENIEADKIPTINMIREQGVKNEVQG